MLTGNVGELMLKPLPVIVGCVTETLLAVPFVIVSVRLALWPTVTVPKFKLVCATVTAPPGGGVLLLGEFPCTAWQPSSTANAKVADRLPAQRLPMAFTC